MNEIVLHCTPEMLDSVVVSRPRGNFRSSCPGGPYVKKPATPPQVFCTAKHQMLLASSLIPSSRRCQTPVCRRIASQRADPRNSTDLNRWTRHLLHSSRTSFWFTAKRSAPSLETLQALDSGPMSAPEALHGLQGTLGRRSEFRHVPACIRSLLCLPSELTAEGSQNSPASEISLNCTIR